jgi:nucleotide-binding universal stress UspA family protein
MKGYRAILCPVDYSRLSRSALRHGAAIAQASRGRLTVLYVSDPLLNAAAAAAAYDRRALAQRSLAELRRFVARALESRSAGQRRRAVTGFVRVVTVDGKPAQEIVKAAADYKCDLIVIGTHGRRGAARLFLGSTTEGVLRRSPVPVLVIPAAGRRRGSASSPGPSSGHD